MTRIAILCNIIEPGGMGNDAFGMYEVLSAQGHEVALFAEVWRNSPYPVRHYEEVPKFVKDRSSCLIYHFAIGWDPGLELLRTVRCKRVVRYHNVTPPEFYEPYSPEHAAVCRKGREQIPLVARAKADLYLSASEYNARELAQAGLNGSPSVVVPPFHQVDRLEALEPDAEVLRRFSGTTSILSVGRVVPQKRHDLLIGAFARYHHEYDRASRLFIVGIRDPGLQRYNDHLQSLVDRLDVKRAVHFTGLVSDNSLRSYYQIATVYLSTSEHEGFCIPLVEAMSMKVPVVAVGSSAVPETVGKAGLVWHERDPALLAESLNAVGSDQSIRSALASKGFERYQRLFSQHDTCRQFNAALSGLLERNAA